MSKFRKIFAFFAVATMLLSSVSVANAAVSMGSLVKKASSATVYFVGENNGLYTFPSQVEFFSRYANFDSVQTVSDAEFASFHLGGTMGVRPGTWMVKVPDFSETYAVESGAVIRHVGSEAVAASLFGATWNKWIRDINPNTFAATYKTGSALSAVNQFPSGHLVSVNGTKYLVDGNKIRPFASDSAFTANMFRNEFVHEVAASAVSAFSTGTSITGLEQSLLDYPSGTSNNVPVSGDITVSLSANTPASMSVPTGAGNFVFTAINITNGASSAVNLTSLTMKRYGISSDNVFDGIKVLDSSKTRHGGTVSLFNGLATVNFSSDPIVLAAGASTTVYLAGDLTSTGDGTIALGVESASGVTTSGGTIKGAFPVKGNEMSVISGSNLLGTVRVDVVGNYTQTLDVGDLGETLAQFKLFEVTNESIAIDRIVLTNRGSAAADDVANLKLYNESTGALVGTSASLNANNEVIFNVSGLTMQEGNTVTLTLKGDVTGGTNRTVQFVVEEAESVTARGLETGVSFLPTAGTTDTSFPVGDAVSSHTINQGATSLNLSTSSPSNKITSGSNQVAAKFDFTASGEKVEIREINVGFQTDTTTKTLDTLGLQDGNGNSIASSVSNVEVTTATVGTTNYNAVKFSLSPYLALNAGETKQVKVVAQLNETDFSTNKQFRAAILGYKLKLIESNIFSTTGTLSTATDPSTVASTTGSVAGNTLSVEDSSLTITIDSSLASTTIVTGSTDAALGQFIVAAGAAEAANISNFTVGTAATGNTFPDTLTPTNAFSGNKITNVKLYKWTGSNWQKVGDTSNTPSNAPTFSVSGELNLAANQSAQIRVLGTIASSGVTNATTLKLTAAATAVASPSNKSLSAAAVNLQTMTMSTTGGVLSFNTDNTSSVSASTYVASESMVNLTDIKFTTTLVEGAKISKVILGGLNFSTNVAKLYLYDGATKVGEQPLSVNALSSQYEATFSGLNVMVAKGGSKVLTVKGDTTGIQALATNANGTRFIAPRVMDVEAVGDVSNLSIEPAATTTAADTFLASAGSSVMNEFVYSSGAASGVTYPTYGVTTNANTLIGGSVVLLPNGYSSTSAPTATTWSGSFRYSRLGLMDVTNTTANVDYEVGDLIFVADIATGTIASGFAVVTTAVASGGAFTAGFAVPAIGDAAFNTADALVINLTENVAATAGAMYIGAKHDTRVMRTDDVEAVLTNAMSNTTLSPQANQMVGKFNVKASGGRDMTVSQLVFTVSGSNSPFSPYDSDLAANCTVTTITDCKVNGWVLKDSNDQVIPATLTATVASQTAQFALTTPIAITQGQTKEFRLYANTSNIKMNGASTPAPVEANVTLSARLEGSQGPFSTTTGAITYSYVSAFDNTTTVSGLTISDNYPVAGATITY